MYHSTRGVSEYQGCFPVSAWATRPYVLGIRCRSRLDHEPCLWLQRSTAKLIDLWRRCYDEKWIHFPLGALDTLYFWYKFSELHFLTVQKKSNKPSSYQEAYWWSFWPRAELCTLYSSGSQPGAWGYRGGHEITSRGRQKVVEIKTYETGGLEVLMSIIRSLLLAVTGSSPSKTGIDRSKFPGVNLNDLHVFARSPVSPKFMGIIGNLWE